MQIWILCLTANFSFWLNVLYFLLIISFQTMGLNADEEKKMNATYIISIARKLGCSIFLLPEDITEVLLESCTWVYIVHVLRMHVLDMSFLQPNRHHHHHHLYIIEVRQDRPQIGFFFSGLRGWIYHGNRTTPLRFTKQSNWGMLLHMAAQCAFVSALSMPVSQKHTNCHMELQTDIYHHTLNIWYFMGGVLQCWLSTPWFICGMLSQFPSHLREVIVSEV